MFFNLPQDGAHAEERLALLFFVLLLYQLLPFCYVRLLSFSCQWLVALCLTQGMSLDLHRRLGGATNPAPLCPIASSAPALLPWEPLLTCLCEQDS